MTTYKELGELMRNLPTDETWLPMFLQRLKDKDPEIYRRMMEQVNAKTQTPRATTGKTSEDV
jgi:hypothetical protein